MDRALIIKKEWIDKILSGEKIWEMRSTKTKVSGLIGLIESGSGLIVGQAILEGVGEPIHDLYCAKITYKNHQVSDYSLLKKWRYPWVLSGAVRFTKPIPYDHPQGAVVWVKV